MRKQIAAANWKMNLTVDKAEDLLNKLLAENLPASDDAQVVFAVPAPYLQLAVEKLAGKQGYSVAAQNCSNYKNGAYTGEISVEMLTSLGVKYCVIGHSERREYFGELDELLQLKLERCLDGGITPIFCCGEALEVREKEKQNDFVKGQLEKALFPFSGSQMEKIVIAYEPIWAIGTGKTATAGQAQQMHAFIRSVLAGQWGEGSAQNVSILYGGSVKAANAVELFSLPDVDGGLVGGASLMADEFAQITKALKH